MDCATFKELAAMLALGALDGDERVACERHLAQPHHDGCVEALAEAMASVSSLDEDLPPPAAHLWDGIAARIAPSAARLRAVRRRAQWTTALAFACAAALVLALWSRGRVSTELAALRDRDATHERTMASTVSDRDTCRRELDQLRATEKLRNEAVALLELPGTQLFPLAPEKGQKAASNVIMHTGLKRAYVVAEGLRVVPDRDYELWVAKGKRVVPAGLVSVGSDGKALVRVDYASLLGDVGAPDAMMITLEPRGGGPVVRGPTILLGTPRG